MFFLGGFKPPPPLDLPLLSIHLTWHLWDNRVQFRTRMAHEFCMHVNLYIDEKLLTCGQENYLRYHQHMHANSHQGLSQGQNLILQRLTFNTVMSNVIVQSNA